MPNPRQVAHGLGERLREVALPTARGVSQISASIGVVPLSEPPGASVDRALQCAGDAMYSAKAAGRDQWLLAHSQDPASTRLRWACSWPSAPASWRWQTRSG